MAITYEWDIQSIDVISEYNESTDVVSRVVWKCTGSDGTNTKEMTGVQDLNISNIDPNNFVPYETVTKEQLIEWAVLDTFDMLSPEYDNPQSFTKLNNWIKKYDLDKIRLDRGDNGFVLIAKK